MHAFRRIIDQTLRNIRGAPLSFAAIILTMAIGIGANTAIFSIVKSVLLEPLPYPESDHLVTIQQYPWTPAEVVLDLEGSGRSFDEVTAFYPRRFAITGGDEPYELEGAWVAPGFFRLFRVKMARGRDFEAADARPDAPRTAIISYALWQRRYGGLPGVIGRTVQVDGEPHDIVGITDRGFRQYAPRSEDPAIWIPFEVEPTNSKGLNGGMNYVIPLARLKTGVTLEQAQSQLDAVLNRFKERHPELAGRARRALRLATIKSELVQDVRAALLVLQLAVGVVLLIACVNVANLLLARFSVRQREMAIRTALGASRGRLFRQLLAESMVLSVMGGAAGLLLMLFTLKLVVAAAPRGVPRIGDASIDIATLLFTLGLSIATGLLFGVIPATVASRPALYDVLKACGRAPARSRRQRGISQLLVIAEVTLTLLLLVGAGLLVRSFVALTGQEPGFRTERILAVPIHLPESRYVDVPRLERFYLQVVERLRQIPGVESVAVSNNLPISRGNSSREYVVEGAAGVEGRSAQYGVVSPDYFRTLEIPLLKGRTFEETDRRGSLRIAVIDEAMWREGWPGQDPIGKRFRFEEGEDGWLTVMGVVAGIRGSGLANDHRPGFYISYQQRPETPVELALGRNAVLLVSTRADAESLAQPLRQAIWDVDPRQPISEVTTLDRIVSESVTPQRFRAVLMGAFSAIALILVIAGIYGVIACVVVERTHEIGVRMAFGAPKARVLWLVVRQALVLTAVGVAVGVAAALGATRLLTSFLFGVSATDWATFGGAALLLGCVAVVASYVPARGAARVDPMVALRRE
jgi:putative ABC transport system permease protein